MWHPTTTARSVLSCICLMVVAVNAEQDHYTVLAIKRGATQADIKSAWRKLSLKYHPDKSAPADKEINSKKFTEARQAFEVLSDSTKRSDYDTYGTSEGASQYRDSYSQQRQQRQQRSAFGGFGGFGQRIASPPIFSATTRLHDRNWDHYVDNGGLWLVKFYKDSCRPCREGAPAWERLAKDVKGMLRFGVVDVGDSNQFSEMSTSAVIRLMFGHRQYSIPVVFGYDGSQWHRHTGATDYSTLFRFATRLIPTEYIKVTSDKQAERFLKVHALDSASKPARVKVMLFSEHSEATILFRHAAFALEHQMDFGFKTFRAKGLIERQFGIAKAPALLIMKEGSYAPVIQTTLPKSHKALYRFLVKHKQPWLPDLSSSNYKSLCKVKGVSASWCLIVLQQPQKWVQQGVRQFVEQIVEAGGQICSELAAPIALASVDVKMQGLFVSKMLESVPTEKRKQCAAWEAKGLPCLLLVDARHKVVAPYTNSSMMLEGVCSWAASVEQAISSSNGGVDEHGNKILWRSEDWGIPGDVTQEAETSQSEEGEAFSLSSALMLVMMAVWVMKGFAGQATPGNQRQAN